MLTLKLLIASGMLLTTVALKVHLTSQVVHGNLVSQTTITCDWAIEKNETIEEVTVLILNKTQFVTCPVQTPLDVTSCIFFDTLSKSSSVQMTKNKLSITVSLTDTTVFLCEVSYFNGNISSEFLAVTVEPPTEHRPTLTTTATTKEPPTEQSLTTTATTKAGTSTDSETETVIIVSSVLGSVAALAAIVTFLVLCLRYKKHKQITVNLERQRIQTA